MNFNSFRAGVEALFQAMIGAIAIALLLAACGGGGYVGDVDSTAPPPVPGAVFGPDNFLLYPNAQSSPAIDSNSYAQAYYNAIDPNNLKDTFDKWKTANGFGSGTGSEVQAVFGDMRDLGYGRYVTARKNNNGTYAFFVDNYLVWPAAGYSYSSLNLDAAVVRDQRWYIGTNGIEFSPGPNGGASFAKYFNFDAVSGARRLTVDMDGRGEKAVPGICASCHGGRADPLTPADASGQQLFPLVGNPATAVRGDFKGKLHFLEVDTFGFSTLPGFTRADQEASIKTLNKWVLCTYPLPFAASGVPITTNVEDACRSPGTLDKWQGGAADIIKAAYGGDGLPNASYADNYVPASWVVAGQTSLYQNVVKPTCRMCHILRGVGQQSERDFSTFSGFYSAIDRIKAHMIDRGNMPLTKMLYDRYWATPDMFNTLNEFLKNPGSNPASPGSPIVTYTVLDSSGAPLKPGRPLAITGPDRTVPATAALSAANSLFADKYSWSISSGPAGGDGSLSLATGVQTNFNATVSGTYTVQLVASKGSVHSDPETLTIVVNSTWPPTIFPSGVAASLPNPLPGAIRFADIKAVLQAQPQVGSKTCISCHVASPADGSRPASVFYADIDRNADLAVASGVGGTDDIWFYTEVRGRINFADIASSPLLRRPSGYHHNGGIQAGFGDQVNKIAAEKLVPGDPLRANYDLFLNWILNGAPY